MARQGGQQTIGVRETIRALQEIEPKLKNEAVREMKKAAKPLADAMKANFPSEPPLSGMVYGRLAWRGQPVISTKYRSNPRRGRNEWTLLSLTTGKGYGAADLFDYANTGSLGANLSNRFGATSRAMWRVNDRAIQETEAAVLDAVKRVAAEHNAQAGRIITRGI